MTGNVTLGPFELLYFANNTVVIQSDDCVDKFSTDRVIKAPKPNFNATKSQKYTTEKSIESAEICKPQKQGETNRQRA